MVFDVTRSFIIFLFLILVLSDEPVRGGPVEKQHDELQRSFKMPGVKKEPDPYRHLPLLARRPMTHSTPSTVLQQREKMKMITKRRNKETMLAQARKTRQEHLTQQGCNKNKHECYPSEAKAIADSGEAANAEAEGKDRKGTTSSAATTTSSASAAREEGGKGNGEPAPGKDKEPKSYPNPPVWPKTVTVFHPDNEQRRGEKQGLLNQIFMGFADGGPGVHNVLVNVGYYHHVLGLGRSRKDTKIHKVQAFDNNQGTATCNFWRLAEGFHTPQNLDWYTSQACALRRVKTNGNLNLAGKGSSSGGFVSDADVGTPSGGGIVNFSTQQQFCLRNVRCWNNGLKGHAANPSGFGQFVYISSPTVRGGGDFKNTVIPKTPIIAEKPYLVAMKKNSSKEPTNKSGSFSFLEKMKKVFKKGKSKSKTLSEHLYYMVVPPAKYNSVSGWDPLPPLKWFGTKEETGEGKLSAAEVKKGKTKYGRVIDFTRVHIAEPPDIGTEINAVVDEINAVLASTEPHVVLTPGIYRLTQPIVVRSVNAVLYGLGLATLICELTAPCLRVSHAARGSRISGLLIEPGLKFAGDVLVDVEEPQSTDKDKDKKFPGFPIDGAPPKGSPEAEYYMFFHDFFVRAGGDTNSDLIGPHVSVKEAMLRIKSHHVVLDNIWLWRADHDLNGKFPLHMYTKPPYYTNRVKNGLQVFGDHVSFYMLAVEHIIGDHVLWKGNFGRTYFYQCEFPYDLGPTSYAMNRFVSYHVVPADKTRSGKDKVFQHDCRGLAVYSMFMDSDAAPAAAIQVPDVGTTKAGQNWIRVEHANTHQICCGGGIASVINGRGGGVGTKGGSDAFQSLIVTPGHTRYER